MSNPTRAEAIKRLLDDRTQPDLAALYHAGMEVQVNVARDEGIRKEGNKQTYTDGVSTWFAFRIPKSAWAEPEDNSGIPMTYPIFERAEGIGMTGWCFKDLRSRWVAFDFDAIVGHSDKHQKKMSDEDLAKVKDLACGIPWVEVRRSTSGSGIHLYVHFAEPVPTKNHVEHAALAKAILAEMSALAGFDFQAKVDTCGGNMWVWHRKMPRGGEGMTQRGGEGLKLVRAALHPYQGEPKQWQRYAKVVKGERKKSLPSFAEGKEATFDETVGQQPRIPLDPEHKEALDWALKNGGWGWWDSDHHMWVTHTWHLKRYQDARGAMGRPLKGNFQTDSPGTQTDEQNCFLFPMRNGSWSVRRYSPGAAEHPSWEQDGKGWTRCYFNRDPDLRSAARSKGGVETDKGYFQFTTLEDVEGVVQLIGGQVDVPGIVRARPGRLIPHKDGRRVVVAVDQHHNDDASKMKGWYSEKGKEWRIVLQANAKLEQDNEVGSFDEFIRHCTNETRVDAGWFVKVDDHWNMEPKSHVGLALLASGKKRLEADLLMGASVSKPWVIVNRPFEDEYPGDRMWNRSKVRLRFPRSEEVGDFSTWRKVLLHTFQELDAALVNNGWALANDIKTGAEWAELWLASAIQNPYAPTPYVFLWSNEQDTGKSIFHEMLPLLITEEGIVEANKVVDGKDSFNGIMEGAVFCYLEELDLQKNKGAYERIKNWVTSPRISVRHLYVDAYMIPNTTHWIHCANPHTSCPIFPGDSRIVMVNVPVLGPKEMIPKPELMERLKREAPHFLNHLLQLEVPPSGSRLAVPVIQTSSKDAVAASTMSTLERYLDENTHYVPGAAIRFSEFFDKFKASLEPVEAIEWKSNAKVSNGLPLRHPVGKVGPDTYVGNISWTPKDPRDPDQPKLILGGAKGRQLVSSGQVTISTTLAAPTTTDTPCCGQEALGHRCARLPNHDPPHVSAEGMEW